MKIIRQRFRYRPIIAGKAYDFVVFKLRFIARTTYLRIASSCQENYTPFAVCTPPKTKCTPLNRRYTLLRIFLSKTIPFPSMKHPALAGCFVDNGSHRGFEPEGSWKRAGAWTARFALYAGTALHSVNPKQHSTYRDSPICAVLFVLFRSV